MKELQEGWHVPSSRMAKNTFNPIRSIVDHLKLEPNPDKPMIALSIGDPSVFGNLKPAQEIIDAISESIHSLRFNGYAPCNGFEESRAAVAKYSSTEEITVTSQDVMLVSGCSCALDMCISVLANEGQNIVIPRPGFSLYRTLAEGISVKVKYFDLLPERQWEVDIGQLEAAIDSNTAAIVINNPSNPCGSVYSKEHLEEIIAVAERARVPIIADEIYEHFVYPGQKFIPMAAVSKNVPILSCSGLTKRFLVPGWRMGWIIIHDRNGAFDKEVRRGLHCLSQRIIGSNTLVQGAIPAILESTPSCFFDETIQHGNAITAYEVLRRIPGLTPIMPQGAMYMMIGIDLQSYPEFDSELAFVTRMVSEESVFCLPGQCFNYASYVRIVLTVPSDILREALERITAFCERHCQISTNIQMTCDVVEVTCSASASASDKLAINENTDICCSLPITVVSDGHRRP